VQLQEAVAQLSTPILRVWRDVVALPIIGTVDESRALAITERTLEEVARGGVRHVILDVTGIEAIDARTFEHLSGLVRAVRLLGANCVVCGLGPQVACNMVELGVELAGLVTARDLHVALARIVAAAAAQRA
jgi:rsbT co-antagonist protein RsbR